MIFEEHKGLAGGFTLIEMLLVIAIIAILAGIIVVAINPGRQLAQARNAQRASDLKSIHDAVHQYYIDNQSWPTTIEAESYEICANGGPNGCIDLSNLVPEYLSQIPTDPQADNSGYTISKSSNNLLALTAPNSTEYSLPLVSIGTSTAGSLGDVYPPGYVSISSGSSNYVRIADLDEIVSEGNDFTLAFWHKIDGFSSGSYLESTYGASNALFRFARDYRISSAYIGMKNFSSEGFIISSSYADNDWHQYIYTWDDSTNNGRLWIDGSEKTTTTTYHFVNPPPSIDFVLGYGGAQQFDELMVFDDNLDDSEVATLAAVSRNSSSYSHADLVSWYMFGENFADRYGVNSTGSVTGTATIQEE